MRHLEKLVYELKRSHEEEELQPITEIDVELWLGSAVEKKELIEIITMVATGEYPRENLVRDISDYHHTEYQEIDWDTFDKQKGQTKC